jgi:hypothetical protein
LVIIEIEYGNPIIHLLYFPYYLKRKTISGIINYNHILHTPINNPQIFHIYALLSLHTTLPEQSVLYMLSLRIQVIQHNIGIAAMRGREHDYLEMGREGGQDLFCVGTDVDACLGGWGESVLGCSPQLGIGLEGLCRFSCRKNRCSG